MTIISSCGVSQSDYEKISNENKKLKTENEQLLIELDEFKNGAEVIIANVEKAYLAKDYLNAKLLINKLYEKHPESPKNTEFKELLSKIEKEEAVEKQKKRS